MIYTSYYKSPIGNILLASKDNQLIGLWFENQKHYKANNQEEQIENDNDTTIIKTKNWLDRYFNNEQPNPQELKLNPKGTDFQETIWKFLLEIPYGEVITYKDLATQFAKIKKRKSMSSQAIGGAVGHNPISIIIPCHRVVSTSGSITGYAGGIEKKVKLLIHENVDMKKLYIKKKGDLDEQSSR